ATTFLGCIAVLPMSDTIALRNIFLVFMVLLIFGGLIFSVNIRRDTTQALKIIPIPIILWFSYLFIFPYIAIIPEIAWENLRGQWGESIVSWIVGFGAAVIFYGPRLDLWKIGYASAFPILTHLVLACISYFGLFSTDYYAHQTLAGLFAEVTHWTHGEFNPSGRYHPIENGFFGIETQQGNIGYASSIAIGVFAVLFWVAKRTDNFKEMIMSSGMIILCFLSALIARTRGGLLFGVLAVVLAAIMVNLSAKPTRCDNSGSEFSRKKSPYNNFVLYAVIAIVGCVGYVATKADPRWATMVDKVRAGFLISDPLASICNGLSTAEEFAIRDRLTTRPQSYIQEVIEGVKGQDGGRVLLTRAGIQLVLKNPLGLDGSRQSYERLIRVDCNSTPALNFANAHNSWIDLSLALGWIGVILFFILLTYFLRYALITVCDKNSIPIIAALGLIVAFWLVRGFFDSLYREHYLQMQGIIISYLYTTIA
ncbi:MAG: hypothetical protein EBY22_14630, partial [Gammaproteobacteria bacterium]|nr:hypothetical protein [Gammaproteobacteria bacterium]